MNPTTEATTPGFAETLTRHDLQLRRGTTRILQINLGKLCNQTCIHCHVGAGPGRKEVMSAETADRIIDWMEAYRPAVVDITGGAPELCPEFRRLAQAAHGIGAEVLVRCNLTVIFEEGETDLPDFYVENQVELVCSLPCYSADNVDKQRGNGVFDKSIRALQIFNEKGYARDPKLVLTLVYNPIGPSLPPEQAPLEAAYKQQLKEHFDIEFDRLLCITNLPVTRFALWLKHTGKLEEYHQLLFENFNPATVDGLMCRDTINVGWEGDLFDCDFNQMLDLPMGRRPRRYLWDVEPQALEGERIATGRHCFGCTAGAGSSCGGTIS
ncbi:MAG: arsenosugar biosynthesis radical SAM (seleno)protein ArsS [Planctomycetota bacterium]